MLVQSLWGYFYLYLHSTLISHKNNIVLCSPHLWDFVSLPFKFDFIPLHSQALSLTHHPWYTSFYLVPLIIHQFSPCFTNFTLISLNILLYTSDYVYRPIPSSIYIIQSLLSQISTLIPLLLATKELFTRNLQFIDCFSLVLWCWCGCFLTIQHSWMYHHTHNH